MEDEDDELFGFDADQVERLGRLLAAWEAGRFNTSPVPVPTNLGQAIPIYLGNVSTDISAMSSDNPGSGSVDLVMMDPDGLFLAPTGQNITVFNIFEFVVQAGDWIILVRDPGSGQYFVVYPGLIPPNMYSGYLTSSDDDDSGSGGTSYDVTLYNGHAEISGLVSNDLDTEQYIPGPKTFTNDILIDPKDQYPLGDNTAMFLSIATQGSNDTYDDSFDGARAIFYGADYASANIGSHSAGMGGSLRLDSDNTKPLISYFELVDSHVVSGIEYALFNIFSFDPTEIARTIYPSFSVSGSGTYNIGQYGTDIIGNVYKGGICTGIGTGSSFLNGVFP